MRVFVAVTVGCLVCGSLLNAEPFSMRDDRTGKTYGPFELTDGAKVVLGGAGYTLIVEKKAEPSQGKLTKEQWNARAAESFKDKFGRGGVGWVKLEDWTKVMGAPNRTQSMGSEHKTIWYYDCSDGTIQMVLSTYYLDGTMRPEMGKLVNGEINEY